LKPRRTSTAPINSSIAGDRVSLPARGPDFAGHLLAELLASRAYNNHGALARHRKRGDAPHSAGTADHGDHPILQ